MSEKTVNQVTTATNVATTAGDGTSIAVNPATEEGIQKMFTQDELNQMIGDRLARERAKYSDYESLKEKAEKFDKIEEESKTELQKATEKAEKLKAELDKLQKAEKVRLIREEVAGEIGVPANLLTAETKEDCEAQAKAIMSFAKPDEGYPTVKDAGEVTKNLTGSAEEKFAEWWLGNQ